jgi:hypothetical protein
MNLYRIGNMVLNMDRVNGILDHHVRGDAAGPRVLRVLFDDGHIDLDGHDAESFRQWFRHVARHLGPQRDEDGEELISPEEQMRKGFETLLVRIDQTRPRDGVLRRTAHRLADMLDHYLTGELQPVRVKDFESDFAPPPGEEPHIAPLAHG